VGFGDTGAPVLVNFAPGETAAGVPRPPAGGANAPAAGPKPTELLLVAAGACTGLDVISLLQKMRVPFTGLHIDVVGERAPEHPKYFTKVEVTYRLKAAPDAGPSLERAAEMSMERYCSVGHSLRARPTWRCEVEAEEPPRG